VIDRLSAAYVGALGNTWIHTPAFDRLAAESLVLDRAMIDSPAVAEVYHSYWTGETAWENAARESGIAPTIAQFHRDRSLPTVLITDDEDIATHPLAKSFDEIVRLAPSPELQQATDWQDTELARFFAAAAENLIDRHPPSLVWLHTAALGRIWDSPQSLRDQYAAEDDPPALALIEPPSRKLGANIDPDVLLQLRHAYAGEITVLDNCLGTLLDSIAGSSWSDALMIATACRGYPLGEHGTVGRAADELYAELIQVPWFVRVPGGVKFGTRRQDLAQPADLAVTVRDWLATTEGSALQEPCAWFRGRSLLAADDDTKRTRKLAVARSATREMALATPHWFVRTPAQCAESDARKLELYVKPDDRFEANEVSDRCLETVEEFHKAVQALETSLAQGVVPNITLTDQ
jgi:arylsulfatase A-like enzyme